MNIQNLKQKVLEANLRIVREGLVILTWGNVSAVDRDENIFVIKPSGVPYEQMTAESMVVVSMTSGLKLGGELQPSSDTPTHLELYKAFSGISGIVHTHSLHATAWAQAGKPIPVLGTTHADHFRGPVPVTRQMRKSEIRSRYEHHTGRVIVETFRARDPMQIPGVLVNGHAPFAWGSSLDDAVKNAVTLERVAQMASESLRINRALKPMNKELLEKHFLRKHGPGAYYGQKRK